MSFVGDEMFQKTLTRSVAFMFVATAMSAVALAQTPGPPAPPAGSPPVASGSISIANLGTLVNGDKLTVTTITDSTVTIEDGYGDNNKIHRAVVLVRTFGNVQSIILPDEDPEPNVQTDDEQDDDTENEPYNDTFIATYSGLAPGTYTMKASLGIQPQGFPGITAMDTAATSFTVD